MITKLCIFDVVDNTGGFFVKFIGIPGFTKKKSIGIGDLITCSVLECSQFKKDKKLKLDKGAIYNFLIVQQKKFFSRLDGSFLCMDQNSVIVITKKLVPRGTRIIKPILKELRRKFIKVVSIACYII